MLFLLFFPVWGLLVKNVRVSLINFSSQNSIFEKVFGSGIKPCVGIVLFNVLKYSSIK